MTAGRVLLVCTANQCRSPMAEMILRHALVQHESALFWDVSSAGTRAEEEQPIYPVARDVLVARGIVVNGFRSRRLTPAMIEESDLVLTAERSHRAEVVSLVPDALHRAFTLNQFARLVGAGATSVRGAFTGDDHLAELIDIARRARSRSQPGDDDLADPIGRRRRHVEATALRIEIAVSTILAAMRVLTTDASRTLDSVARVRKN